MPEPESVGQGQAEPAAAVPGIHPTALLAPGARVDPSATIGPYVVLGPEVEVGAQTAILAGSVVEGRTRIGASCRIGPQAVLGGPPQIRGSAPEAAGALEIGDGCCLRELVTVHRGGSGGLTRLGEGCLLMVGSHVAHDCQLGEGIELANGVQLAGHVQVEQGAAIGGLAGIHQYARIGCFAFVGAGSMVSQDVLPFTLVSGDRARTYGLNTVGLRRQGFSGLLRRQLAQLVRLLLCGGDQAGALADIGVQPASSPELTHLLEFAAQSSRGCCRWAGRLSRARHVIQ